MMARGLQIFAAERSAEDLATFLGFAVGEQINTVPDKGHWTARIKGSGLYMLWVESVAYSLALNHHLRGAPADLIHMLAKERTSFCTVAKGQVEAEGWEFTTGTTPALPEYRFGDVPRVRGEEGLSSFAFGTRLFAQETGFSYASDPVRQVDDIRSAHPTEALHVLAAQHRTPSLEDHS
ncbi:MAG: hypothetical protein AAFW64_02680 [Pseudomonadota bacterium]